MLFPVVLHSDDGVKYGVTVPDIPGCFSAGDTLDDALSMAKKAISAHVEWMIEEGDDLPVANSVASHIGNPDYAGGIWALVDVDLTAYMGKSEKINITLPRLLISKIDKVVSQHGEYGSRSGLLATAALREIALHSGRN
jgi:predicted RNase H-like HicB family nuclease